MLPRPPPSPPQSPFDGDHQHDGYPGPYHEDGGYDEQGSGSYYDEGRYESPERPYYGGYEPAVGVNFYGGEAWCSVLQQLTPLEERVISCGKGAGAATAMRSCWSAVHGSVAAVASCRYNYSYNYS